MVFSIQGATKAKARKAAQRQRESLNTLGVLKQQVVNSNAATRDELAASVSNQDAARTIDAIKTVAANGALLTVENLLPILLNLKGKPYSLRDHFVFSPLFRTQIPAKTVFMTGRQVSKSTGITSSSVIRANWIPDFTVLFVCPLYEQIRRLSGNLVKPFIERSPVRQLWSSSATQSSVLQYTFKNYSKLIFSFALLDADRVRGISADAISFDEVQDLDPDHIPIIDESLSHSEWRIRQYTGTPKTFDNTIQGLFNKSSQAAWHIPCLACGEWNIASIDGHLLKMIGPNRADISEEQPGTICFKCQRPINPRGGRWYHNIPERRNDFAGYQVPQLLMPVHYASPVAWKELLSKQQSGTTSPHVFFNEVLGTSYDIGSKLLTITDLTRAAILPWHNEPREAKPAKQIAQLRRYKSTALSIDWGGGGESQESYTALALLGLLPSGKIDVIWGKRLYMPNDHLLEAHEIVHWVNMFNPNFVTHDATGTGALRETILAQSRRMQAARILGVEYVGPQNSLIRSVPPSEHNQRRRWRMDKSRSMLHTITALRSGIIRTFAMDHKDDSDPGLLYDFLALIQEKVDGIRGGDLYRIKRQQGSPDDFAHAVNIGSMLLWHIHKAWPDFFKAGLDHPNSGMDAAIKQIVGDFETGWENDPSQTDFLKSS